MLGFEREALVDVPDQSQKMTYTDGGAVGNYYNDVGTDSQELDGEHEEALTVPSSRNFNELGPAFLILLSIIENVTPVSFTVANGHDQCYNFVCFVY